MVEIWSALHEIKQNAYAVMQVQWSIDLRETSGASSAWRRDAKPENTLHLFIRWIIYWMLMQTVINLQLHFE